MFAPCPSDGANCSSTRLVNAQRRPERTASRGFPNHSYETCFVLLKSDGVSAGSFKQNPKPVQKARCAFRFGGFHVQKQAT